MATQPDISTAAAGPRLPRRRQDVVPSLIGGLVALTLGVYGRLHNRTGVAINIAGFSSPGAVKSWLATVALCSRSSRWARPW